MQKGTLEREPQDAKDVGNLDTWKKHAMNMFMILTHHHLLHQSPREREAKKNVTIVESCAADPPQDLVDPPQDFPDPPHEFSDVL